MKFGLFLLGSGGLALLVYLNLTSTPPESASAGPKLAFDVPAHSEPTTQLGRAVASAQGASAPVDELEELARLPAEQRLGFARAFFGRLAKDQFPRRLAMVARLDEMDRLSPIAGFDELVLAELDPGVLNDVISPTSWKRAHAARVMAIYARLRPGLDGKARLQEKINQQTDPDIAHVLTEAKHGLEDLSHIVVQTQVTPIDERAAEAAARADSHAAESPPVEAAPTEAPVAEPRPADPAPAEAPRNEAAPTEAGVTETPPAETPAPERAPETPNERDAERETRETPPAVDQPVPVNE
jgi:hypothetical protein